MVNRFLELNISLKFSTEIRAKLWGSEYTYCDFKIAIRFAPQYYNTNIVVILSASNHVGKLGFYRISAILALLFIPKKPLRLLYLLLL